MSGNQNGPTSQSAAHKWRTLWLLALAELLAMSLWFSASAVVPQLTLEWALTPGQQSWLTMSVQIGFVVGALASALLTLADRVPAQRLFAVSAVAGASFNAAIAALVSSSAAAMVLRFAHRRRAGRRLSAGHEADGKLDGSRAGTGHRNSRRRVDHRLGHAPLAGRCADLGSDTGIPPWQAVLMWRRRWP